MTNWSIPHRIRLVMVRRRMGTPATGSRVFGVSSEYGRSRVAQPAARMTAFIEVRLSCNDHAQREFGHLEWKRVESSPPEAGSRNSIAQFLPRVRHRSAVLWSCHRRPMTAVLDALVLADGPSADLRVAGLTLRE